MPITHFSPDDSSDAAAVHAAGRSKDLRQTVPGDVHSPLGQKAVGLIERGEYDRCLKLLSGEQAGIETLNLRAVCFLRMGQADAAVSLLRPAVLCTRALTLNKNLPRVVLFTFGTALLMSGRPAGCLDVLNEINDRSNPHDIQLRGAIRQWAKRLPLWDWLNWKMGRIEPTGCRVPLDFPPGAY